MEDGFYNNGRSDADDVDEASGAGDQNVASDESSGTNDRAGFGKNTLRSAEEAAREKRSAKKQTANNAKQKIADIGMRIVTKGKSGGKSGKTGGGTKTGAANGGKDAGKSDGLFSGSGGGKGKGKGTIWKYSAMAAVLFCVVIFGVINWITSVPRFLIGTLDYNLQDSLGFSDTEALLEQQAEHTTAAMLKNGEFPDEYAADLAKVGIDVGQVTASGEFVRTNIYIADLNNTEVAANGDFQLREDGEGSLAVMYDGELIAANDFVAAVESNPKMYADYSEATDISARFYYSSDVDDVYKDMGVSRGNFNAWEPTGDAKEDQQQFNDTLAEVLEDKSDLNVNGYDRENDEASSVTIKTGDDAGEKVSEVSEKIKDDTTNIATTKAAQLLNSAISSNEPYKAAKAFIAIEEPIQRARIGDNGPVNEMMNVISTESELTYTDVNTGEKVTKKRSILSTTNFAAAASGGSYSKSDANNFSRDRVLTATKTADESVIKDTTVSSSKSKKSNSILGIGQDEAADDDVMQNSADSVAIAATENSADLFESEVGGNRAVEGGSFISNTINAKTIGAMPSDQATITSYHHEIDEVLARKAEAERVTKNPFDISSPYTFAGNIVHTVMGTYVRNLAKRGGDVSVTPMLGTIMDVTSNAVGGLVGGAVADGENDKKYTTLAGDCYTVPAVGAVGDLYGTSLNTNSTKYMDNDDDDWKSALPDDLDSNGKIISRKGDNGIGLSSYLKYGNRDVTVGVKSYEVCEAYRKDNNSMLSNIFDTVKKWFGLYESCNNDLITNGEDEDGNTLSVDGVPAEVATGQLYTLTSTNKYKETMEKYSGYVLYDTVKSLLSSKKTAVAEFREEYYAKNPKDNSAAGIIARRSGMSKAEAQIALDYAERLAVIANYDPSTRYVFGKPVFQEEEKNVLLQHSDAVQVSLYCVWSGKAEYADVRNRSFAA